jgi:hypothetical protein
MANIFETFLSIDPIKLGRRDSLGDNGFDGQIPQLQWIYSTIREAIEIKDRTRSMAPGYVAQIQNHAQRFVNIAEQIQRYNMNTDAQSGYNTRNTLIRQIDSYYNSFFSGDRIDLTQNNSEHNNFLTLLNTLKTFEVDSLRSRATSAAEQSEIELKAVQGLRQEAEAAAQELSKNAFQPGTLALYAEFFDNEAKLHSRLGSPNVDSAKKKGEKIRAPMGGAEKWLIAALCMAGLMLLLVAFDIWFYLGDTGSKLNSWSPLTVSSAVLLAILFYLTRFFFKQFSIHKHLFTLNRHRSNSMSSFFSMVASGGMDDSSRSEVTKILAKAIYESAHTGYIPGDSSEVNLPVTIDAIRGWATGK